MWQSKHRQFVEREMDWLCCGELLIGVVEGFPSPVEEGESNISGEEVVQNAAKILLLAFHVQKQ